MRESIKLERKIAKIEKGFDNCEYGSIQDDRLGEEVYSLTVEYQELLTLEAKTLRPLARKRR